MNNLAQFWMRHSSRLSIDDQNLFYIGMVQALEQDTFPDHARCSGYDCFYFHESYAGRSSSRDLIEPLHVLLCWLLVTPGAGRLCRRSSTWQATGWVAFCVAPGRPEKLVLIPGFRRPQERQRAQVRFRGWNLGPHRASHLASPAAPRAVRFSRKRTKYLSLLPHQTTLRHFARSISRISPWWTVATCPLSQVMVTPAQLFR